MKKYPKLYYLWLVLLVVWSVLLVFSLLVSVGAIPWHSKITVLQYIMCGMGLFSAAANICFWRKKGDE